MYLHNNNNDNDNYDDDNDDDDKNDNYVPVVTYDNLRIIVLSCIL